MVLMPIGWPRRGSAPAWGGGGSFASPDVSDENRREPLGQGASFPQNGDVVATGRVTLSGRGKRT